MNQTLFRSEDEWKAALLTLPDNAYLDLMRSVFGNIKTPFNKHRLVEDIVSFLSRRETQEIITAYIDEIDRRIISAIAVLGEPVPGDLESFFSGEYSYLDVHGMLLNLEERLIVYRFQEDGVYHLALNPLLESVLRPCLTNRDSLLPSVPLQSHAGEETSGTGMKTAVSLDDRILAALFAFILDDGDVFKTEGGLRKKVLDNGKRIFPSQNVERLIGGLHILGLLSLDGNRLIPDIRKLTIFKNLSHQERREYWAGGIYSYCYDAETITRYPHQGRTQKLAQFVHRFIGALDFNRVYPQTTLRRLVEILEKDEAGNLRWAETGMIPVTIGAAGIGAFLEALETAGLVTTRSGIPAAAASAAGISPGGQDFWRLIPVPASASGENPDPVIAMDTPFSCILYPEISFPDALLLAAFCSVRETGTTVRFELTRESVVRGFDFGFDADAIIGHLERLSGKDAAQNLRWTLRDWGNRYAGVALYQGTILVLSEERRYLAQAEPVASLIVRSLGPGVYLLSTKGNIHQNGDEAVQGLQKAGVDIIARPPLPAVNTPDWVHLGESPGTAREPAPTRGPSYPPLKVPPLFPDRGFMVRQSGPVAETEPAAIQEWGAGRSPAKDAASYQARFRQALGKLSLPQNEADELAARIGRRLILNESQLTVGAVRSERMEARNLDFVGKTIVAKQAIALKSPVEIFWVAPEGEPGRLMGIPGALEKSGGEIILALKTIPEGNDVRLPLGKISLIRRIKQSIFGE